MAASKPIVKIENWYVLGDRLYGEVNDHPNFNRGDFVKTSAILDRNEGLVVTKNTIYELGKEKTADEEMQPTKMLNGAV